MNLGVGGKEIAFNRTQNLRCLWTSQRRSSSGLQYKLELRGEVRAGHGEVSG